MLEPRQHVPSQSHMNDSEQSQQSLGVDTRLRALPALPASRSKGQLWRPRRPRRLVDGRVTDPRKASICWVFFLVAPKFKKKSSYITEIFTTMKNQGIVRDIVKKISLVRENEPKTSSSAPSKDLRTLLYSRSQDDSILWNFFGACLAHPLWGRLFPRNNGPQSPSPNVYYVFPLMFPACELRCKTSVREGQGRVYSLPWDPLPLLHHALKGSSSSTQWINILLGRLFYDVFTCHEWSDVVRQRIQRKLNRIKVPFFMEELTVTEIRLGSQLPYIRRTSEAVVDKQGTWVDLDLTYNGAFQMTLSTKLNLMRLKRSQHEEMQRRGNASTVALFTMNHEGSEEESAVSSEEEEGPERAESSTISKDAPAAAGTGKKLLDLVDKIAQSKYFQQATENRYIKRKMEEVSNTPLVLTVEVSHLVGTLALNVPPPPTDRIWYGFRTLPKMELVARPKLGEKEVTFARVTERIEKMLFLEFQRILVMPNMDDFMIPIMHSYLPEC
ncbi:unnamed protein product [Ixodes hexagonus]